MKLLGLMLAASAAACDPGASNGRASAPEQDIAGPASEEPAAAPNRAEKARGERADGAESRPRPDAPIAGSGGTPSDPPGGDADQCGASRYQWLVGRPRSAIPARPSGATWRIACASCPITQDYSSGRLNIFYDTETERIEEVRCG